MGVRILENVPATSRIASFRIQLTTRFCPLDLAQWLHFSIEQRQASIRSSALMSAIQDVVVTKTSAKTSSLQPKTRRNSSSLSDASKRPSRQSISMSRIWQMAMGTSRKATDLVHNLMTKLVQISPRIRSISACGGSSRWRRFLPAPSWWSI